MRGTTGNTHHVKRPLRVADLCEAIANGMIVPVVQDSCYQINIHDVRKLVQTLQPHHLDILAGPPTEIPVAFGGECQM